MKATIDGVLLEGTVEEIVEYIRCTEKKVICGQQPMEIIYKKDKRKDWQNGKRYVNGRGNPIHIQVETPTGELFRYKSISEFKRLHRPIIDLKYEKLCQGLMEHNPFLYNGYKITKVDEF